MESSGGVGLEIGAINPNAGPGLTLTHLAGPTACAPGFNARRTEAKPGGSASNKRYTNRDYPRLSSYAQPLFPAVAAISTPSSSSSSCVPAMA